MRKLILLTILLAQAGFSFAQISYEKDFNTALKKAAENKQPVFLNIGAPGRSSTPSKSTAKSAINNKEVVQFYNKNFVSYMVSIPNKEAVAFVRKYQLKMLPAYIFLDTNGTLIAKGAKSSSASKHYLDLANQALSRLSGGLSLGDYDEKYKKGKVSKDFLKEYITARQQLGILNNAKLIDEYVDHLTIGAFNDYNEVLFVLKAGPFAYGKAYKLAYTNRNIIDSIYKTVSRQEKIDLNNAIINNTQAEAIATKNLALATSLSNYIRGTNSKNYAAGDRQARYKMLAYYKAVKDTGNYYRQAQYYYDQYLRISADSIQKITKKLQDKRDSVAISSKERVADFQKKHPEAIKTTYTYSTLNRGADPAKGLAMMLNNAAWDFYTMGTRNINYLTKAMLWSRRALELSPTSEYYDTMAHIFYRMQLYDEALLNQDKAIELASKQKNAKDRLIRLREAAEKMKQREL